MSKYKVTSRCECQALLGATLDEHRHVLAATATLGDAVEVAPAHSIGAAGDRFDVGWQCPHCGRNTLRTFFAEALRVAPDAAA